MRDDIDFEPLRKYRRENFQAKIEDGHGGSMYADGLEKSLTVTFNGRQWHSIPLLKEEAISVIRLLEVWVNPTKQDK